MTQSSLPDDYFALKTWQERAKMILAASGQDLLVLADNPDLVNDVNRMLADKSIKEELDALREASK
jgi:TusA-related sulfurtransferase